MAPKRFTEKQKQQAVALYLEEGATAAAASIGCTRRAIYHWLGEYGLHSVNDEEKRQATLERHTQKRLALAEIFLDQSMTMALAADEAVPLDAQRLMTTAAIASQKHLELTGGPSASPPAITVEWLETEIGRLEQELGKVAPNNSRALQHADEASVDASLRQAIAELERKIRSDYEREQTGRDKLGRPIKTAEEWNDTADRLNSPNGHRPLEDDL